jgi:hypothetical protein
MTDNNRLYITPKGYVQCDRCHTWRPVASIEGGRCKDWTYCQAQVNGSGSSQGYEVPK